MIDELNVKVGDQVVLSNGFNSDEIAEVEKVTAKGSILVKGILFDKYGFQKGGNVWSTMFIPGKEQISYRC